MSKDLFAQFIKNIEGKENTWIKIFENIEALNYVKENIKEFLLFDYGQLEKIIEGFEKGFSIEQVDVYAKNHFTEEQMEWLRLIKEHIIASLSIEPSDLDLNPFDHKGGLGRFYEVFGDNYEEILNKLNEVLIA